jgi:uncharacterized iron-regulated membrane protein
MSLRKILFWSHLTAGCAGGLIILTMSITGVLLTYERQILAKVERGPFRAAPPHQGASPLAVEELLARVAAERGGLPANAVLTRRSDASEPAELAVGREGALYVNPYTGQVLGNAATSWRKFFQEVTAWHRWLGAKGEGRTTAKAITGACNLAFLLLIVTGPFIWWPKQWTRQHLASIVWFLGGLSGRARDFNWHNAIGIWCAVPLFIVVLTATPMSYTWANNLVYKITGTEVPAPPARPAGGGGPGGGGARAAAVPELAGLNQLWARAEAQQAGWQSIGMRLPEGSRRPVVFTIDTGDGGQPQKRATLTLERATASVVRWETFAGNNAGRRLRSWSRFAHTGEAYGLAGQTIAGIASAGGAVLVWTGIALSLRRLSAWRRRRARAEEREETEVAA